MGNRGTQPGKGRVFVFRRIVAGSGIWVVPFPQFPQPSNQVLAATMAIESMGAYTFSKSSRFNGFEPPQSQFID